MADDPVDSNHSNHSNHAVDSGDRPWEWLTGSGDVPPADLLPATDALANLVNCCEHAAAQLDDPDADPREISLSLGEVATTLVAAGVDLQAVPGDPDTNAIGQGLRNLGAKCQHAAVAFVARTDAGPAERDQARAALTETITVLRQLLGHPEPTADRP